ncbi:MAG TPA: hypothetical protein PJ982_02230 [Lacipirellulaceae bacterium]|nr:hypothetical protein [Lacipirellulaceae bacterium]
MNNPEAKPRRISPYRLALVASIGGFLFGFDLGMIGAANVYLRDQFGLSDAQFGFATASAVLGSAMQSVANEQCMWPPCCSRAARFSRPFRISLVTAQPNRLWHFSISSASWAESA